MPHTRKGYFFAIIHWAQLWNWLIPLKRSPSDHFELAHHTDAKRFSPI